MIPRFVSRLLQWVPLRAGQWEGGSPGSRLLFCRISVYRAKETSRAHTFGHSTLKLEVAQEHLSCPHGDIRITLMFTSRRQSDQQVQTCSPLLLPKVISLSSIPFSLYSLNIPAFISGLCMMGCGLAASLLTFCIRSHWFMDGRSSHTWNSIVQTCYMCLSLDPLLECCPKSLSL